MTNLKLGKKLVGIDHPAYFVADISANHDGDLQRRVLPGHRGVVLQFLAKVSMSLCVSGKDLIDVYEYIVNARFELACPIESKVLLHASQHVMPFRNRLRTKCSAWMLVTTEVKKDEPSWDILLMEKVKGCEPVRVLIAAGQPVFGLVVSCPLFEATCS